MDIESYNNKVRCTHAQELDWTSTDGYNVRVLFQVVCGSLLIPNFRMLRERTDAVEEILETSSAKLTVLRQLLRGLPDLARGLCRIQYGKVRCSLRSQGLSEGLTFRSPVHPSGTCGASTGIQ